MSQNSQRRFSLWQGAVPGATCFFIAFLGLAQTPAFPGAVGHGKDTTVGRSGSVYRVTTLADSGSNGPASGTYYVLRSTNLSLSVPQWTRIVTNPFDSAGKFMFTDNINLTTPQNYFLLQVQTP